MTDRVDFINVNDTKWIHRLYAGDESIYYLNFNWYWHEISRFKERIVEKYIVLDQYIIGYIVFGPHFKNRLLTQEIKSTSEVYHLVIDYSYQGAGIGQYVMTKILNLLFYEELFEKVYVSFSPDNESAKDFYKKIGMKDTGFVNYDDDPIYEISKNQFVDRSSSIKKLEVLKSFEIKKRDNWEQKSLEARKQWSWSDWEKGLDK